MEKNKFKSSFKLILPLKSFLKHFSPPSLYLFHKLLLSLHKLSSPMAFSHKSTSRIACRKKFNHLEKLLLRAMSKRASNSRNVNTTLPWFSIQTLFFCSHFFPIARNEKKQPHAWGNNDNRKKPYAFLSHSPTLAFRFITKYLS
jgi:hypothetical protein